MRTSPPGMRRPRWRAPLLLLSSLVLVVALGACSDDGGDEGTSPTTTSPSRSTTEASSAPDDGSSTTSDPADTTTSAPPDGGEGTIPGDDADVLTVDQATAQLDALLTSYQAVLVEARTRNALDEATLQRLTGTFTGSAAQAELATLQQVGGPAAINPEPPDLTPTGVELAEAEATCASGQVVIEAYGQVIVPPVDIAQPFSFRLVPAPESAGGPAWRIDVLRFGDGAPEEARCP